MPSHLALPTIADLLEAFRGGVQGERDETADVRSGSNLNLWAGLGAILFQRTATRDRDIFRNIYFDFAEGDALDAVTKARFGVDRVGISGGMGKALLLRPTAAAGAGTIWQGTRMSILQTGGSPLTYSVTSDVAIAAGATSAIVPITAETLGASSAVDTSQLPLLYLRLEDPLWDATWTVQSLTCGSGADRQKDGDYRAIVRKGRLDSRVGYAKAITDACVGAGATQVALFASDFASINPGTGIESVGMLDGSGYGDCGMNRVYVGDAGFQTTTALQVACMVALDSVAIAGTGVQVLPMTQASVAVTVTVNLWQDPSKFDTVGISQDIANAIVNYFATRRNAFYFRAAAIQGAVQRLVRGIQSISVSTTPSEPSAATLFSASPLPRYNLSLGAVTVNLAGPA